MRRNILLVLTCMAMCVCVMSCGTSQENLSPDEITVFTVPDPKDNEENETVTGEILEEQTIQGEIAQEDETGNLSDHEMTEDEDDSEDDTGEDVIVDYGLYARTTGTVNLRARPSTDADVVKLLGRNTVLRVAGIDEDQWAHVQTEAGEEGFVFSDYISEPVSEDVWIAQKEQLLAQKTVCIDAGHQAHGNNEKEPVGPGATETKAKVSSGTKGVSTGKMEYELTLEIALKLQEELERRGYTVIMCRTTNDVDISNSERAAVANNANADAFIRIHADGSENSSAQGAHTICQTAGNPYNGQLYGQSLRLSQCVISEYVAMTGAKQVKADDGVDERDDLSGVNWCVVPVTLIELGFMTNPTEDTLMSSADYQAKMVTGMANGIDKYFAQ